MKTTAVAVGGGNSHSGGRVIGSVIGGVIGGVGDGSGVGDVGHGIVTVVAFVGDKRY